METSYYFIRRKTMKKLSRIAALLAAGALLFGAVGCSDSDDDGGDAGGGVEVTASVAPAIELEEGKSGTYVVTCTVIGDTFSAEAKSLDKGDEIPDSYLNLTASDSKVVISEVKVSEKFTDTVGKVSIKVAAAVGAKSGTITAKLLNGTLTDTTDTVTATSISYTIKDDNGGVVKPPVTTVTNYTLVIDSDFPTISSTDTASVKLDDTVTVYATASGKAIQAYPKATPPVVKMTGGSANITAGSEYGLQLTLAADAKITITALTKQGKDAGQWTLKGMSSGASVIDSTGTPAVASAEIKDSNLSQSATPAALTFASVPKGTYMLGAKSDGGYLFSLKIEY